MVARERNWINNCNWPYIKLNAVELNTDMDMPKLSFHKSIVTFLSRIIGWRDDILKLHWEQLVKIIRILEKWNWMWYTQMSEEIFIK